LAALLQGWARRETRNMTGRFTDTDVADVAKLALTGLAHQSAA
jgi:hypothetical protein